MRIETTELKAFLGLLCPEPECAPDLRTLLVTIGHVVSGSTQAIDDFSLEILQGRTRLCEATLPPGGELTEGDLVVFGAGGWPLGPITLRLTGVDLSFLVQNAAVLNFALVADAGQPVFRTVCLPATANASLAMIFPDTTRVKRFQIRRELQDIGAVHTLDAEVVKGEIRTLPGPLHIENGVRVIDDRVDIVRESQSGELVLAFTEAGLLLSFRNGELRRLVVFGQGGLISRIALLGLRAFSSFISVAPLETLP